MERLTQDFPDRPEHGRELARTLSNLGNVLAQNRSAGAEPILRRAVEVKRAIIRQVPERRPDPVRPGQGSPMPG